jgi:diaminopimelate dehydrogenase
MFNTVDSFDTHAKIPGYFKTVDEAAKSNNNLSIISVGWDPGLFSMNRLLSQCVLPDGNDYTFWGRGVSQGHSDAIRRIEGVQGAVQYTIPIDNALEKVRTGENPELTTREKHIRDCYVVAKEGADKSKIENEIKTMPNYFADYDTNVTFISEDELKAKHSEMPHGGFVIRSGKTGEGNKHNQIMEFSLKLDSNPELTGSVLVAYARAIYRLSKEGATGAKTVFDIPLAYLSPKSGEELREQLL